MNHSEIKLLLTSLISQPEDSARQPLLITGKPGIGKSAIVQQIATQLGYRLITIYCPLSDPIDSRGIPVKIGDGEVDFLPVGELKQALNSEEPTILFFDELGQAAPAVQAGYLSLVHRDSRAVGGLWTLPAAVYVCAATNDQSHKAGVSGFIEPLKSRFAIVELTSSLASFLAYAVEERIEPEIQAFLRWKPELLNAFEPSSDLSQSPCERQWEAVSDLMSYLPKPLWLETFAGLIGDAASEAFTAFCEIADSLPLPSEIVSNPETAKLPDNMAGCYAVAALVARLATRSTIEAAMIYVERLSIEYQAVAVQTAISQDDGLFETEAVTRWITNNSDMIL